MRHDEPEDDSMPGQDSFVDVICNMVGILITLVVVVGMRVSQIVIEPPAAVTPAVVRTAAGDATKLREELEVALRARRDAEYEIETALVQSTDMRINSAVIEGRREALSLLSAPEEVEEIECVPTPLAKTVTGDEIHVRLRHGQLAIVPVDELLAEVERRGASYLRGGLEQRNQAQDVYGPIDGFRLRLSVNRIEESPQPGALPGTPRRAALVLQGVFTPTADDLGLALEQALLPSSPLAQRLRARKSAVGAVTVWVYPDSYAELRSLKKAMWEAGVPLAVRPLGDDQPIVFSTLGSKSAAQ
jgi:hypothetical protein